MGILALTRRKSSLKQDYKIRASNDNKKNNRFTILSIIILMIIATASVNYKSLFNPPIIVTEKIAEQLDNSPDQLIELPPNAALEEPPTSPPLLTLSEKEYEKIEFVIKRGDTLEVLFQRENLDIGDLALINSIPAAKKHIKFLRPNDMVMVTHNQGDIISLTRHLNIEDTLFIEKNNGAFSASIIKREIQIKRKFGYGKIETSLFESAIDNGMNENLIMNLAEILAWDIDFVFDIRINDDFYVLYEEIWQDDKFIANGKIIAVEFNNNGRTLQAINYTNKDDVSNYFTPDGKSMRKAFVRAPLDFTRVSSNFNPNRKHPILNTIRAHRGVDYAAPKGTIIKASGDGKVIFKGVKSGYGNVIILQHGENITTLYAHMSRFAASIEKGQRVKQNQTIGFVGSSGLATAPHLHYEYRIKGTHQNPRTVTLPQAAPINKIHKEDFEAKSKVLMDELRKFKEEQIYSLVAIN